MLELSKKWKEMKILWWCFVPWEMKERKRDFGVFAPATKSILDDLLEEFGEEILNVTMVNKGEECSPTKDLEELERLVAKDARSH
ncbi:hypothetical protein Tco_1388120 [Tanacetum coccineum]